VHSFAEVAEIASRVLGMQITYKQPRVDTFAESIDQTGNALFKEHCRAVAVEAKEFSLERIRLLRRSAVVHR
jgi:hypothetical protein